MPTPCPNTMRNQLCSAVAHRGSNRCLMARRLQQASSMAGQLWPAWCKHLLKTDCTWMYVLALLSHMLCLRVSEALALRASDFSWKGKRVRIRPLKRQPETHKRMLACYLPLLKRLKKTGAKRRRQTHCGARGKHTWVDQWSWPSGNRFLFPNRTGKAPMSKDIVCHRVVAARQTFVAPKGCMLEDVSNIRTHSARHRAINDYKTSGIAADVGMVYARIKHKRTYDCYGRLDQQQCGTIMDSNNKLQKRLRRVYQGH